MQQQGWLGSDSARMMPTGRPQPMAYGPHSGCCSRSRGRHCKSRPKLSLCMCMRYRCRFKYSRLSHRLDTIFSPLPSSRQYLSCDACLEVKREDNQNCSMLCCVRQLCTMIRTQMWAVLAVLWIGFYLAGFISLCIDLFVFICV